VIEMEASLRDPRPALAVRWARLGPGRCGPGEGADRGRRAAARYRRPGRDLALGEERIGELRDAAEAWNAAHGGRYEQIRVDVIGWTGDGTGQLAIEHVWEAG
jgi:hypothetical protein